MVTAFLDDLLAIGTSIVATNMLSIALIDMFYKLGLCFHATKCVLDAVDRIDHLGFTLDIKNQLY